ncbi:glycoside hydrolase family 26 protein [Streptomyces alkaliterrae]|uniref:Glycosyl hydrolase family 26 n=1 Tax=Streptomyces alkaliterrae TaxID=2213162 RepID=A0A5P0YYK5_9ACTN|nr:glycosyl hydrolase family 26 [Streptomyces alkaliterrae]MQS05110.1 glycosyl hydrolase family 26 [Streptomyces alkaliterrae]
MSHRRRWPAGVCAAVVAAGLLVAGSSALLLPETRSDVTDGRSAPHPDHRTGPSPAPGPSEQADGGGYQGAFGAFLASGPEGVQRIGHLERWLGGANLRVGHTYLPGDLWSNIEGRPEFLRSWARWRQADEDRMFVLNVPMLERNEDGVPDHQVRRMLRAGAEGSFDHHFETLGQRLVRLGVPDTIVVLGWEMNGTTYTHRCAPDPAAWKAYWKRIVTTMREVPGQRFQFDFAPNRGRDAIPWTQCYPGDDVVDIIGMDSYDQPPGDSFDDHVNQPYGLKHQVDFAAARGKPISYPEWGLFRNGDNAEYMRRMIGWMKEHKPLYQTISDYCPHGVWQCRSNPRSSAVFRQQLSSDVQVPPQPPTPTPTPTPTPPVVPTPPAPTPPRPEASCMPIPLSPWAQKWVDPERLPCVRYDWREWYDRDWSDYHDRGHDWREWVPRG